MTQMNFKKFFRIDYVLLRYPGSWISDSTEIKPVWYNLYSLTTLTILASFNLSVIIYCVLTSSSLRDAAAASYEVALAVMTPIKIVLLIKYNKELSTLIDQFDNIYFQATEPEEIQVVTRKLSKFKKVRRGLTSVAWFWGFMLIVSPFGNRSEQKLLFPAWFPFDVTSSPGYQIAYGYQSLIVTLVTSGSIYTDCFMVANCTFVGLQCSLLAIRLRKIGRDGNGFRDSLFRCIQHHKNILRIYEIMNKVFGEIYFWQLISSATSLCMTLFLMSVAEAGSYEFFLHLTGSSALCFMLLVPCWFATEMTTNSEKILPAAFYANWLKSSTTFKRDLVFFMLRVQKPLILNGAWFFTISIKTFIAVLRASMSYYTCLNNLNSSK